MGRAVRAETWVDGARSGRVWFRPPASWRIEDAAGDVTYIENATDEYRRDEDGVMVHSAKSRNRIVATVGEAPEQLLQAYSLWPLEQRGVPLRLRPVSAPRPATVHGRPGWEVWFVEEESGAEVTYVIDADCGVALSKSTATRVMELSDPVLDEDFDPGLFLWAGPTREESDRFVSSVQREHEQKAAALAQMPRPQITWLPGTIESHPSDGDPRTGALDLQVHLRSEGITVLQWLTEIGEPELDWMNSHVPSRYRKTVGPWTYEIRSRTPIGVDDCARVVESIVPADPPSGTPEQIRAALDLEAAEKADAELQVILGTGRRLDDHLGDRGGDSLLVRTDFSDDAAWRATVSAVTAPGGGGSGEDAFYANLTCIDHPENDGLSISDLLEKIGDNLPYYVFLADRVTIADPEHPILAVDTGPEEFSPERGQTVRVIPSQMWSIENNLALANMDFEDFVESAGADGVYRGF